MTTLSTRRMFAVAAVSTVFGLLALPGSAVAVVGTPATCYPNASQCTQCIEMVGRRCTPASHRKCRYYRPRCVKCGPIPGCKPFLKERLEIVR